MWKGLKPELRYTGVWLQTPDPLQSPSPQVAGSSHSPALALHPHNPHPTEQHVQMPLLLACIART